MFRYWDVFSFSIFRCIYYLMNGVIHNLISMEHRDMLLTIEIFLPWFRMQCCVLCLAHEPVVSGESAFLNIHWISLLRSIVLGKIIHVFVVYIISCSVKWTCFQISYINELSTLSYLSKLSQGMLFIIIFSYLVISIVVSTPTDIRRIFIIIKLRVLVMP